jgi:hypothetical protein
MPSMGLLRPAGYPAHRAAGRWVFDVLVALAASAAAVPVAIHDNGRPQTLVIVVLAVGAAPLVVRRIWPLPVFGAVLAVNLAAGLAGHAHPVNGAALLVALYTVAAIRPRRDALVCTALLELPAAPTSPSCTTGPSGWNASETSRARSPQPPNAPGSPGRCTTSSPTISPSWSP